VKSSTPVLVMTEGKTPRSPGGTPETNVRSSLHRSSGRKPEGMTRKANPWNTGTGGAWQARLVRLYVWMAGWQMQCCGAPFQKGSEVSWHLWPVSPVVRLPY
jgi:hypothetical protein